MTGPDRPAPAGDADRMREGWVVFPLLAATALADLRQAMLSLPRQGGDPTSWQTLAALVRSHATPDLAPLVEGQRLVFASAAGPAASPWQQLPCINDEAVHRAYRLWLPLEAAALRVVPRSHHWSNVLRGDGLPSIWRGHEAAWEGRATHIPVAPGSAVLFDRALLHRLPGVAGIALDWVAAAAPLRRYHHDTQQPDAELIACFSSSPETEDGQDRLLGHIRQNLDPVRPQDLQALRMGIIPAIYRPIQDPNLLQSIPKARPGFAKR